MFYLGIWSMDCKIVPWNIYKYMFIQYSIKTVPWDQYAVQDIPFAGSRCPLSTWQSSLVPGPLAAEPRLHKKTRSNRSIEPSALIGKKDRPINQPTDRPTRYPNHWSTTVHREVILPIKVDKNIRNIPSWKTFTWECTFNDDSCFTSFPREVQRSSCSAFAYLCAYSETNIQLMKKD